MAFERLSSLKSDFKNLVLEAKTHKGYAISLAMHPLCAVADVIMTNSVISAGGHEYNFPAKMMMDFMGMEAWSFFRLGVGLAIPCIVDNMRRSTPQMSYRHAAMYSNFYHLFNINTAINSIPTLLFP